TRFIGQIQGEVDAVAEAEFVGEPECQASDRQGVAPALDAVHKITVIVADNRLANLILEAKPLAHDIAPRIFRSLLLLQIICSHCLTLIEKSSNCGGGVQSGMKRRRGEGEKGRRGEG